MVPPNPNHTTTTSQYAPVHAVVEGVEAAAAVDGLEGLGGVVARVAAVRAALPEGGRRGRGQEEQGDGALDPHGSGGVDGVGWCGGRVSVEAPLSLPSSARQGGGGRGQGRLWLVSGGCVCAWGMSPSPRVRPVRKRVLLGCCLGLGSCPRPSFVIDRPRFQSIGRSIEALGMWALGSIEKLRGPSSSKNRSVDRGMDDGRPQCMSSPPKSSAEDGARERIRGRPAFGRLRIGESEEAKGLKSWARTNV